MHLEAFAKLDIAATPQRAFDLAADYRSFARIIRPRGPIPGVDRAEMIDDATPASGARRRVTMTDKTTVEEEILAFDRPRLHRYRWVNPPAPPLNLLVRGAVSNWSFEPSGRGDGTTLSWTYRFELTSILALPLAFVLKLLFEQWMAAALARVRELAEASA